MIYHKGRLRPKEIGGIDQEKMGIIEGGIFKKTSKSHHFIPEIAMKYGVKEAIVLNRLCQMMKLNRKNNNAFHWGLYWTFSSQRELLETVYQYFTAKEIRNIYDNLYARGAILKARLGRNTIDATLWYTVVDNDVLDFYDLPRVFFYDELEPENHLSWYHFSPMISNEFSAPKGNGSSAPRGECHVPFQAHDVPFQARICAPKGEAIDIREEIKNEVIEVQKLRFCAKHADQTLAVSESALFCTVGGVVSQPKVPTVLPVKKLYDPPSVVEIPKPEKLKEETPTHTHPAPKIIKKTPPPPFSATATGLRPGVALTPEEASMIPLLEHWNDLASRVKGAYTATVHKLDNYRQTGRASKTVKEICQKLHSLTTGSFYTDYPGVSVIYKNNNPEPIQLMNSTEELTETITHFFQIASNPRFYPVDKTILPKSMSDFLVPNPYTKRDTPEKPILKSWMWELLTNGRTEGGDTKVLVDDYRTEDIERWVEVTKKILRLDFRNRDWVYGKLYTMLSTWMNLVSTFELYLYPFIDEPYISAHNSLMSFKKFLELYIRLYKERTGNHDYTFANIMPGTGAWAQYGLYWFGILNLTPGNVPRDMIDEYRDFSQKSEDWSKHFSSKPMALGMYADRFKYLKNRTGATRESDLWLFDDEVGGKQSGIFFKIDYFNFRLSQEGYRPLKNISRIQWFSNLDIPEEAEVEYQAFKEKKHGV